MARSLLGIPPGLKTRDSPKRLVKKSGIQEGGSLISKSLARVKPAPAPAARGSNLSRRPTLATAARKFCYQMAHLSTELSGPGVHILGRKVFCTRCKGLRRARFEASSAE
jgi:hypothetical protein